MPILGNIKYPGTTHYDIPDSFLLQSDVDELVQFAKSFEFDNLIKAHEAFPELNIMLTYGKNCGDYRRCFDYGFDIDADYKVATKEMVKEFHDKGLKVGLWTANNLFALNFCRMLDVDYIESDVFGGIKKGM